MTGLSLELSARRCTALFAVADNECYISTVISVGGHFFRFFPRRSSRDAIRIDQSCAKEVKNATFKMEFNPIDRILLRVCGRENHVSYTDLTRFNVRLSYLISEKKKKLIVYKIIPR